MSLIRKLTEKFKNMNENTKKRIIAMALAGTMAISTGVGLAGCGTNTDPSTTITDPSGDTNTDENNGNNNEDNKSYSNILQTVLYDDDYYGLRNCADLDDDYQYSNKYSYNNQRCMSIPYKFLDDEGFDISKIKNNKLYCQADTYLIDNDLYIELRAETPINDTSYNYSACITNYILKYSLTNKEVNELLKLHKNQDCFNHKKAYIEAPIYIQVLSYQKNPEIISKTYTTKGALKTADENWARGLSIGSSYMTSTFLGATQVDAFSDKGSVCNYQVHLKGDSSGKVNSKVKLYNVTTLPSPDEPYYVYDNKNINLGSSIINIQSISVEEKEQAKSEAVTITLLSVHDCIFTSLDKSQYEEVLGK